MKKKLLFPLLSIILLLGCEKEEDFITELTTSAVDNKISFSSASLSIQRFTIESNSNWGILIEYADDGSPKNWLQLSQSQGIAGSTDVEIRADYNYVGMERNCDIIIISEDKEVRIDVNQSQKNILETVSNKYISVPEEGGDLHIKFNSNVNAVLISKPEWIENTSSRSITEKEYSFMASPLANNEKYGRAGEIVYKDQNSGDSLSYYISQGSAIYYLVDEPTASYPFDAALQEIFGENYSLTLKKLKVVGTLNAGDLVTFSNMFVLENLDISEVTIVGDINIGGYIPRQGDAIPISAFSGHDIKSIQLPKVKHIGVTAFQYCPLLELTIPNSVIFIGELAFNECHFSELSIPNSVIYIGTGAFLTCENLDKVSVYWDNSEELPTIDTIFDQCFLKNYPEPADAKYITIPTNSSALYQTKGWEQYNTREL